MIDLMSASPEVLLAYGAGCVTAYAFAMRTVVQSTKDQLAREREMYMERLEKQETRFKEQIAAAQAHLDDYKEQLRICQEKSS